MKKIIVLFLTIIFLVGCSLTQTPTSEVEKYLNNYNNLTDELIMDVDSKISTEDLSNENKELYKKVLLRQYENMKYEIKDESIENNKAIVKADIIVFDYYKTDNESDTYMNEHITEFNDVNGMFDDEVYNTFRLGELLKTVDTTTYEITFNLKKDANGNWILDNPSKETLEKLNGFYIN